MSQHTKQTVWTVTKKIIFKLSNQKEETYDKATLAKVRKTLGKPLNKQQKYGQFCSKIYQRNF